MPFHPALSSGRYHLGDAKSGDVALLRKEEGGRGAEGARGEEAHRDGRPALRRLLDPRGPWPWGPNWKFYSIERARAGQVAEQDFATLRHFFAFRAPDAVGPGLRVVTL